MHIILNKKGAMFGLDARIALAIFGALSVISGAALYSAIQNANVVKWQTYFSELDKASAAYYLDEGSPIPLTSNTSVDDERLYLSVRKLLNNDNNSSNWKGPYLQSIYFQTTPTIDYYYKDSMTASFDIDTYPNGSSRNHLWLRKNSEWTSAINSGPETNELCVLNSTDCAEWWVLFNDKSFTDKIGKLAKLLDEKIDNGDGAYKGNIRYVAADQDYLFFKGRLRAYK
jgi:hypothetical protein